ncbi:MAG: Gfo/Idh/MocA family oxidoreductase [Bacteroidales bacterium]|nr:Gfo/Idh/MocA family oxidoreductase [Bacteroidales bacterium]
MTTRREFIRKATLGTAALGLGNLIMAQNNFARISGANDRLNVAIVGLGGRSHALAESISMCRNIRLAYVCDVDQTCIEKFMSFIQKIIDYKPEIIKDFRKILDNKNIDAVFIATPEHWHAPMAIMAMQAGKHVYVEKPCSHNPFENELLVTAQKKYNKVCQMGNQQRSSVTSALAVADIQNGLIGNAYMGKAWYSNTRGPIGKGNEVPVPSTLDWELWQGPAPREKYRDNIHPYNWHWFRAWGTGEIHNNGTHELDICRWALGVGYPQRVVSTGGRLHFTGDDWEFFDTQMASYEFTGGKTITWEGRSCNGLNHHGTGRGATIHGTKGSIFLDRSKYILYDLSGNIVKTELEDNQGSSGNTADLSGFDKLTTRHIGNFADAIRLNAKLNAPIADAAISTQLCHLGNIAQDLKDSLVIDTNSGKVLASDKANAMWKREYAQGWEPAL